MEQFNRRRIAWAAVVAAMIGMGAPPALGQGSRARATAPVYVEDSPAANELVDEARQRREQGRLTEAVELLQRVAEQYPHKLMGEGDENGARYEDAVLWVRRWIASDEQLLAAYRRVYEPAAERALAEAAAGGPSTAAMEQVMRRYALTPTGLETALGLAALYLEQADASSAAGVLDEVSGHPDLDRHRERYHTLQAIAGLLTGDAERQAAHEDTLTARGLTEGAEAVRAMALGLNPPLRLERAQRGPVVDPAELPADGMEPLWTVEMGADNPPDSPEALLRRRVGREADGNASSRRLLMLPTSGDGDMLYVNDGRRIVALDRSSGRELWVFEQAEPEEASRLNRRFARMTQAPADARGVAVLADKVVGIVGQARQWPLRGLATSRSVTTLAAVDRSTGELLWSRTPGELDPTLERAYFHGTPMPGHGRVYVLVRRSQMSGFRDAFVAALDSETGEVLWRRHISSTVTASRYAAGPSPQALTAGQRVYVSDNVGVVAAIDGRSGQARWVKVFGDDVLASAGQRGRNDGSAYGFARPVVVEAGLLAPMVQQRSVRVMRLDPETGALLEPPTGKAWAGVRYLIEAGDDVLGVGRGLTLFDGRTLEPRWTAPLGAGAAGEVSGMVSVTRDFVAASTNDRVVCVSLDDGRVIREMGTGEPGNVLVLEGQAVLATSTLLRAYLGWNRAYANLTRQMMDQPQSVEPGLALAQLALRSGRDDAVLAGVDHTLAAVEHHESLTQARVFEQVLDLTRADRGGGVELRSALFDRLATATADPAQEAAYQITLARFLEQVDRIESAVDHYQAILLDPTLSAQLYTDRTNVRQAGIEARHRLARLIERHGRPVYQRYDAMAAQRLAELRRRAGPDAAAMTALADAYPLSTAAPRALYEAGRIDIDRGESAAAARSLRRAYPMSDDPELIALIAGALAEAYDRADQPSRAAQWLRRVSREQPGLAPIRDGAPVDIDRWLADLSMREAVHSRLPTVTLPLSGVQSVPGMLMTPPASSSLFAPRDRFMVFRDQTAFCYGDNLAQPLWSFSRPDDGPLELLAMTDADVLLWSPRQGRVYVLEAATGEAAYAMVDGAALLDAVGGPRRAEDDRAEQRQFIRQIDLGPVIVRDGRLAPNVTTPEPGFFVGLSESVIVLANTAGRVAGIDRRTGRTLWQHRSDIDSLSLLEVGYDTIALAGVTSPGTDAAGNAVVMLDLVTGEPRCPTLEDEENRQWLGFTGDGLLIAVGVRRITAYHSFDGVVAWRTSPADFMLTNRCWVDPNLLMLFDAKNAALGLDPRSGQALTMVPLQATEGDPTVQAVVAEHQWQLLSAMEAVAISAEGALLWRDAISSGIGKRLLTQWVTRRFVVVAAALDPDDQARPDDEPWLHADPPLPAEHRPLCGLFVLDRENGAILEEHYLPVTPQRLTPSLTIALDNRLLLGGQNRTFVIDGAPLGPR